MEVVPTIPAAAPENAGTAAEVTHTTLAAQNSSICSHREPGAVEVALTNLTIPDVAEAPEALAHPPPLTTAVVPTIQATPDMAEASTIPMPRMTTPATAGTLEATRLQRPQRHKQ